MSRLAHLTWDELGEAEDELKTLAEANGYVANSMLILARRPEIAKNLLALIRSVMRNPNSTIGSDLAWMVAHVCSTAHGCRYCQSHTIKNGTHYGLARDKFDAIWQYETSPLFSDAERAALRVAQLGGMAPSQVADADMAALRRHYSDEQVVEIVSVIALFGFNNRWNDIMQTDLEPEVTAVVGEVGGKP